MEEKKNDFIPLWLKWARELQAMAQTGLAFSKIEYDIERYKRMNDISAEILEQHSNLKKEITAPLFLKMPGYATPKIDVRAAVIKDDKILLVQEKQDNHWAMPGGWADVGDVPSEVAERETKEESGFEVVAKKVVGVYDANRSGRPMEFFHAFKIIFLCELIGGKAAPSNETLDVGFFDFNDLPPLSTQRTNQRYLDDVIKHYEDPSLPADFD
ncbi:MAG: NUDIX hydrolase [Melioribacteraceae bacterium]|nr:NUDIX hydrolase [Melioribacteraceae bacterium]